MDEPSTSFNSRRTWDSLNSRGTSTTNLIYDSSVIRQFIYNLLDVGLNSRDFGDNDDEMLTVLSDLAESQEGWEQVISSFINYVPFNNCFGPSIISALIDEYPMPTRDSIWKIINTFGLSSRRALEIKPNMDVDKNMCVWLGCIADKMIRANHVAIFTKDILEFLLTLMIVSTLPSVVLYALVALKSYARVPDNRTMIMTWLDTLDENPLLKLERYANSEDIEWRQVGFCAQWALDNVFFVEERTPSYESTDMSEINVLLNCWTMTNYLKLSSDGLEARCDNYTTESARCTFKINNGCWFYEATILTPGIMQFGWATVKSRMLHHGTAVGDDAFSVSFDGCRNTIWYNSNSIPIAGLPPWQPGYVIGSLIDLEKKEVMFYVNGKPLPPSMNIFEVANSGFYAAVSLTHLQHCRLNFGNRPFKYPPRDRNFSVMQTFGILTEEQKKVLPKRLQVVDLSRNVEPEDRCVVCYDCCASCVILPCTHRGFCPFCLTLVAVCPLCRSRITGVRLDDL